MIFDTVAIVNNNPDKLLLKSLSVLKAVTSVREQGNRSTMSAILPTFFSCLKKTPELPHSSL